MPWGSEAGTSGPRLSIVGIGPGGRNEMTIRAMEAVSSAEYVVGYTAYVDLVKDLISKKQTVSTGMGREVDRAKLALDLLERGSVALISSGDPNVYGMAGLGMELASRRGALEKVEVIPGVTSFAAAACRAGVAFRKAVAVISLSDLLTPWSSIERRALLAAELDLPLALYNPRSRRRDWQLRRILQIWLERRGNCQVLVARNVSRPEESLHWSTVAGLLSGEAIEAVDMFSLVLVAGRGMTRGQASREASVNLVGVGPGEQSHMTKEATEILSRSSLLLGPPMYLSQVEGISTGEAVYHGGRLRERVKARIDAARAASDGGATASILVGGDPSIFGSTWRYLAEAEAGGFPVHVSPGVSAFSAVAARAGAPLVNDFVLLSGVEAEDYGKDENSTVSRLVEAGFGVVAYNLDSGDLYHILKAVPGDLPCALARDLGRDGEIFQASAASELAIHRGLKDRLTLILAGSGAYLEDGRIIVRRGYEAKYSY